MKYYKAKKEADQKIINNPYGFIIAGELFTRNEIKKTGLSKTEIKKYFDIIHTNKNNTYFFFGSRRESAVKQK